MSLYRKPRSPFFYFEFRIRGHRFFGSTKTTTRREAEKVEAGEREKAKKRVIEIEAARTSLRLDDVAGRVWEANGQHYAFHPNTRKRARPPVKIFWKDKLAPPKTHHTAREPLCQGCP